MGRLSKEKGRSLLVSCNVTCQVCWRGLCEGVTWPMWLGRTWTTWPGQTPEVGSIVTFPIFAQKDVACIVTCQVFVLTGAHLPLPQQVRDILAYRVSHFRDYVNVRVCPAEVAISMGSRPVSEGPRLQVRMACVIKSGKQPVLWWERNYYW